MADSLHQRDRPSVWSACKDLKILSSFSYRSRSNVCNRVSQLVSLPPLPFQLMEVYYGYVAIGLFASLTGKYDRGKEAIKVARLNIVKTKAGV